MVSRLDVKLYVSVKACDFWLILLTKRTRPCSEAVVLPPDVMNDPCYSWLLCIN